MEILGLPHPIYATSELVVVREDAEIRPIELHYVNGIAAVEPVPELSTLDSLMLASRAISLRSADAGAVISKSGHTLEHRLNEVQSRMGIRTTAGLVAWAFESGAYSVRQRSTRHHTRVRELQVINLTACGLTAEDIGASLGISTACVHSYRKNVRTRLPPQARNNVGLVTLAYMSGLLRPGDVDIQSG